MRGRVGRIEVLCGCGLLALLALCGRIYALTVVQHEHYRARAEARCRRVKIRPARRGTIEDRRGRPLAVDRPVHHVALDLPSLDPALNFVHPLALCLRRSRLEALALLRRARARARSHREETFDLALLPLADAERAARILRRRRGLWSRIEAGGVVVATRTEVLRARDQTIARLAPIVGLGQEAIATAVEQAVDAIHALPERNERLLRWRKPLRLVEGASADVVLGVRERAFELPGVEVVEEFERLYPRGDLAVHAVGYLGAPTAEEVRRARTRGLLLDGDRAALGLLHRPRARLGDGVRLSSDPYGRIGVERSRDDALRGVPGAEVVLRDVRNRVREVLWEIPPRDGTPARLTIDAEIQAALEAALDRGIVRAGAPDAGGAGVLMDLRSGDLLALASAPRFDPNTLGRDYPRLLRDPRKPLLHRAVQAFPPASTFKILTSFAVCDREQDDSLPPDWSTVCTGRLSRKERRFRCDGVHGETDLAKAICHSCNVFFFRAVDRVGLAPLSDWARRLGLGSPLSLDVQGERGGLVPYPGYKEVRAAEAARTAGRWARRLALALQTPWGAELERTRRRALRAAWWAERTAADRVLWPGNVRNSAIGQGDVLLTPLQVARIAALVATGGRVPRPRLLLDTPPAVEVLDLDPAVLARVREGMVRVVSEGTASRRSIGLRGHDVAGKTGTAERRKGEPYLAWFMGYYPASAPEVAFAVLVDRTRGHGGGVCGPIARELLLAYERSRGRERLR
ncbi:MAG: hypothetical protein D6731_03145 [Planctomycetota bacterium]|nr:MAG: hypothetical protein D6731_03145 [Planctomycetota bacterium]